VDSAGFVWSIGVDGSSLWKFADTGALAATYTGIGLNGATALAIDGAGHVWVANGNNSISVLSNAGALITPASGYTGGGINTPTGIAIDTAGNVWISNSGNDSVTEILGGATPVVPLAIGTQNGTPGTAP
jgi:ligand-binding sensor domain-containing protein